MDIETVNQFSVFIPRKTGALSKFMKILMDNNINIIGIASDIGHELGVIRIAVEHRPRLSHILTQEGFTSVEVPMISLALPDKKGQLYKLTRFLARNGVSVNTIYGTAFGGKQSRLLFTVDNMEKARKALKKYNGAK
jgi:hypothetical protein